MIAVVMRDVGDHHIPPRDEGYREDNAGDSKDFDVAVHDALFHVRVCGDHR